MAWLDHTFCPVMTQRSPSRAARVVRPARSEPAPGSLNSWHQADPALEDRRHEAVDLLGGALGEDRRRRHQQPEAARRAQGAVVGERRPHDRLRPAVEARGRPARGRSAGAVHPAAATSLPPVVDGEVGVPVGVEPGLDLVPQVGVRALLAGVVGVTLTPWPRAARRQLSCMIRCTAASSKPPSSLAKSSGWATPSPWGQSEPNRMRSTPMSSASAARSSSRYGRDPDVAAQRVERVLGEHPRRLVGLLAQVLGQHVQPVGAVLDAGDPQRRVAREHAVDDQRRRRVSWIARSDGEDLAERVALAEPEVAPGRPTPRRTGARSRCRPGGRRPGPTASASRAQTGSCSLSPSDRLVPLRRRAPAPGRTCTMRAPALEQRVDLGDGARRGRPATASARR